MIINIKKPFLLLVLCLSALASWAQTNFNFSAEAPTGQTLYYRITSEENRTVTVTYPGTAIIGDWSNYNMPTGELTIPEQVGDYRVSSIGEFAFLNCTDLTSVTIPNSVISIGTGAFCACSSLTNVTTGDSDTIIAFSAFFGCSSLTTLTIGRSMKFIATEAFTGCNNLTTLYYNAQNLTTTSEWINPSSGHNNCGFRPISLQTLVIGNNVKKLPMGVFYGQNSLTSVTIPNSVNSIEGGVFENCSSLTSITIPNSVTSIGDNAFLNCTSLKTIYNLSGLNIVKNTTDNGHVAYYANRVFSTDTIGCIRNTGTGMNILHYIFGEYLVVDAEDNIDNHIPISTIPANFIYDVDGTSNWKAKEIVLTDDTGRFEATTPFTAAKATYTREFANSNRSTLCLPFTAAKPEGLAVYDFTGFDGSTLTFSNHEGNIAAYTPYLVGYDLSKDGSTTKCTITQSDAVFPATFWASPACTTTYNGMTFKGTMERKCMNSSNYGYRDGFFVQSADGSENDHSGHAHVNPFRAYFEFTSGNAPQSLPPTLNVEVGYGDPVGIDAAEAPEQEYDGRYGNDVYDMLGRMVRKNADNLEGLPRGIYIWKGKKVVRR